MKTHDLKFKPAYEGHSKEFWQSIQGLHDSDQNWDENGLSDEGMITVKYLMEYWGGHID